MVVKPVQWIIVMKLLTREHLFAAFARCLGYFSPMNVAGNGGTVHMHGAFNVHDKKRVGLKLKAVSMNDSEC